MHVLITCNKHKYIHFVGNDKCKNFDCSLHPYQQCRVVSGKPQCQCQLVCPLEYLPVCGSDSRTYGNLCMLKAHACETKKLITVSKIGECGKYLNVTANTHARKCTLLKHSLPLTRKQTHMHADTLITNTDKHTTYISHAHNT